MSKLTALSVFNAVLQNIGESQVTQLTGLSGIQLVVWDKITEAIQDIFTDENTRYQPLESLGKLALSTGNNIYPISGFTTGTDMMREDKESLIQSDSRKNIKYKTPQEIDADNPQGITSKGYPDQYTKYANSFVFNKLADTTQNGKYVNFRYWKLPTYYSTDTGTGTSDFPEPFDRTLLVALATLKVLTYLGSAEAAIYKIQVFGDGQDIVGSLDKFKNIYSSPELKPRCNFVF